MADVEAPEAPDIVEARALLAEIAETIERARETCRALGMEPKEVESQSPTSRGGS